MELIKLRNGFSQCNDVRFSTTSGAILFVVEILFYFTVSSFAPLFPPAFSREKKKNPQELSAGLPLRLLLPDLCHLCGSRKAKCTGS